MLSICSRQTLLLEKVGWSFEARRRNNIFSKSARLLIPLCQNKVGKLGKKKIKIARKLGSSVRDLAFDDLVFKIENGRHKAQQTGHFLIGPLKNSDNSEWLAQSEIKYFRTKSGKIFFFRENS